MTEPDPTSERELERSVARLLENQPLRRAPAELSERVWAQLERRAARPWWHAHFSEWPAAARAAFALVSLAAMTVALLATSRFPALLGADFSFDLSRGLAIWRALTIVAGSLAEGISAAWLHALIATIALLYVAFFGVGAATYRALSEQR